MLDEKRQELYDNTIKRLKVLNGLPHVLNGFPHDKIEPFDDKVAVVLLAEELKHYRHGIEERNRKITNLRVENEKLRKIIIKQALIMYGENND